MVQSNKYYKSRAVGVTSEVGLITDRDLAELWRAKETRHLLYFHNTGSHVVWTTIQQIGSSHSPYLLNNLMQFSVISTIPPLFGGGGSHLFADHLFIAIERHICLFGFYGISTVAYPRPKIRPRYSHVKRSLAYRNPKTLETLDDFLGLVSLFNGISTFVGYLMPKPFS